MVLAQFPGLVGGWTVADQTTGQDARYWAFISYSHKDAAFGRRLHRQLENYAVPRRLVGRATPLGIVPRKLVPIFRDREELPAANDLSAEVRAALKASRSLIVVCSPSAAASKWVSREVETFRGLHPDRPVLAAIRDGEPEESFPAALRGAGADGTTLEPLAADFRRGRDGDQLGLLKLVAGVIGVGLDELIQRDAHRRNQRVTAITAGALAAVVVMGVLTGYALNAEHEAERQRGEALNLVRFMHTDLREKLRGLGRLDLMGVVNQQALDYLDRDKGSATPQSLAQRDQVLQGIGEDQEDRGDFAGAKGNFREAWISTKSLLDAAPDDPDRIYNHAQSEYWIGENDFSTHLYSDSRTRFEAYKALAEKLVSTERKNMTYLRELAYAEGNLCALDLQKPQRKEAALAFCKSALTHMETVGRGSAHSSTIEHDLANRHSWLGNAYSALFDDSNALAQWQEQDRILKGILAKDPFNMRERKAWIALRRNLARLDVKYGRSERARSELTEASNFLDYMLALDPSNNSWKVMNKKVKAELSAIPAASDERK